MDEGIHLGEIKLAAQKRALRPDENLHFAVESYGCPGESDLPIFVDLDVFQELERHAQSDTSIELGGVLLGGQFEDDRGQPFVVISDCLQAEHYEATRGSFKFTHDTWSAITRERERFPAELQMVGWYHTHPGWGVFLSGMDLFICENFFHRPLDVAYVIDPCRGERGIFHWMGTDQTRTQRTGGFYLTTSRFRAGELAHYLAEVQGSMPVNPLQTSAPGSVHTSGIQWLPSPASATAWQPFAVWAALTIQCLLLTIIALKLFSPATAPSSSGDESLATRLETIEDSLREQRSVNAVADRAKAQTQLLDQVVRELKGTEEGFVTRLQERFDQSEKLAVDVAARDALVRELRSTVEEHRGRLQTLEQTAKGEADRLGLQIAKLTTENERLRGDLTQSQAQLARLQPQPAAPAASSANASEPAGRPAAVWWWAAGAALAAVLLVGCVWWIIGQRVWPYSALTTSPSEMDLKSNALP